MSASTVTALPHPQWRMMNRLTSRSAKPATPLLTRCDATIDDLLALAERELITGKVDTGEIDLGLLAHDRGILGDFDVRILLTTAGVRWVEQNPSNRALIALDELAGPGGRAKLTDVVTKADVDAEAFLLLARAGLVEFSLTGGQDMQPVDTLLLRAFHRSLHLKLTAKGRELVN